MEHPKPLSRDRAVALLRESGSEAAQWWYVGKRDSGFWVFTWNRRFGDAPDDAMVWVVTDSGAVGSCTSTTRVSSLLRQMEALVSA